METGFLNCYDEEHFSTLSSAMIYDDQVYHRDMLEESEGSILDMIPMDLYEARISQSDPWSQDHEQELNGDIALLPGPINNPGHSHRIEDYHKTLTDWQEHIGTLQNSDNDEIEIKGIFEEMDVVLAAYTAEDSPEGAMFDETSFDTDSASKKLEKSSVKGQKRAGIGKNLVGKDLTLGQFMKEEDDVEDFTVKEHGNTTMEMITKFEMNALSLDDSNHLENDFRMETEDDCIDVETVSNGEQIPVLEAGDLTSLLEQFEASETVNTSGNAAHKHAHIEKQVQVLPKMTQQLKISAPPPTKPVVMTHQNIKDALPKEVIERIKASGRKKAVHLIPAMPSKKTSRSGTRMQDAGAALTRNKFLKIVSSSVSGESIQLDHDYCTALKQQSTTAPPRSFYHSNASDYTTQDKSIPSTNDGVYSRLPDYVVALSKQNSLNTSGEDSRRDSGLESGDASDASEELSDKSSIKVICSGSRNSASNCSGESSRHDKLISTKSSEKIITICGKSHNVGSIVDTWNKTLTKVQSGPLTSLPKKPLVSVLKKNQVIVDNVDINRDTDTGRLDITCNSEKEEPKQRKKLNILEYRSRVKELDRQDSCDTTRSNSPITAEPASVEEAQQLFDQATKLLMNCSGKIDDKTSARIAQTLKDQASNKKIGSKVQDTKQINEKTIWVPPEEITLVEMAIDDAPLVKESSVLQKLVPEGKKTDVKKAEPSIVVQETVNTEEPEASKLSAAVELSEPCSDNSEGKSKHYSRSRRQYRSRRIDSSSSSSPNAESFGQDRQLSDDLSPEESKFSKQRCDTSPETTQSDRHNSDWSPSRNKCNKRRSDWSRHDRSRHDRRMSDISPDRSRPKKRRCDWSPDERRNSNWSPRRNRTVSKSPSPSGSSRSSCSSYSSQSRSSSRKRSRDWQSNRLSRNDYDRNHRSESFYRHNSNNSRTSNRNWRRSRSPLQMHHNRPPMIQFSNEEKQRQVEERRVIYVGQIEETMSKAKLRELFEAFGPIIDISVHFREHGDNYGFVTYAHKEDAYQAVETGKRHPNVGKYELSFGGRRAFCKTRYSDLDGQRDEDDFIMAYNAHHAHHAPLPPRHKPQNDDFDLLMKAAQARIMKRKA